MADSTSSFHPAFLKFREIVQSGDLGKIKHIDASLRIPQGIGILENDDIRLHYSLGGGSMMDMGGKALLLSNRPPLTSLQSTPSARHANSCPLHLHLSYPHLTPLHHPG
jgi:hypothetical protein